MYAYTENILDGKKRVVDTSTNQIETFICYDTCICIYDCLIYAKSCNKNLKYLQVYETGSGGPPPPFISKQ